MPTSKAKADANRRNSRASTGPRTAHGKHRTKLNAYKHGLSVPDPAIEPAARDLAAALIGRNASDLLQGIAEEAALATLEVVRVNLCRKAQLQLAMAELKSAPNLIEAVVPSLRQIERLERYIARARSRRNRAFRALAHAVRHASAR